MNTSRNMKTLLVVFLLLFALLAAYLVYVIDLYGDYWFASPYNTRVTAQKSRVVAGDVLDRNGGTLASTDADGKRTYNERDALRLSVAHVLGDSGGQTIGAQSLFARYLLGFDADLGARLEELLSGEKRRGSDVYLTIDARLCEYAYEQLDGRSGAIVVMNYKTGEILASTSSPSFDLSKIDLFASGEYEPASSSLVNRATMGKYTPGSTFKLVTAIAALRYLPNVTERTFTCTGVLVFDKKTGTFVENAAEAFDAEGNVKEGYALLRDFDGEIHGELTLEEAFSVSCNNVFARLALELGADKIRAVAEELGFNGELVFNEVVVYSGSYGVSATDFELAWSGVGQHTDIVTPMHMCLLTCAVANGGVAMEPKLLYRLAAPEGNAEAALTPAVYKTLLKGNEADFLKACMRRTVAEGTGTKAQIEGYTVCGKTGTAEVSSSADILPHAWFAGFIDSGEHPYAICVVIENGGGGGAVAAPVAASVLKKAISLFG
ncbi:MAG TPA: penicillin-binding transpeptidase domain-containing protein [Clostridia bacterium]|nr:penicillin-binding transpeptidase domain-containing protein [Clostridia bacterium]